MGDILPECLEVQFGWIRTFTHTSQHVGASWLVTFSGANDAFRLRLVRSGSYLCSSNDQSLHVERGTVVLQPPITQQSPSVMHIIEAGESIGVGFRLLLFGNIDITPQLLQTPMIWHPDRAEYKALDALLDLLLSRSTPSTMSAGFIRDGLLRAIVGLCWEPLGMTHLTTGQHARVPRWLAFVMQELRHYPGMTVTDLKRLTGYSHSQLDRLFLQHIGTSPRDFLQRYRFDLATHLLQTTEMTVSAISEHLGFSNTTDFTRFFRRIGKVTPSECRQTKDSPPELQIP